MRKLEVRLGGAPAKHPVVGRLVEDRGRTFFEYDPSYLASGRSLSPFHLPFRPGLHEHTDQGFGPLPGLFDDSLPDGWGLLLQDRHFRRLGHAPATISPLERLAWLGTSTMGALTYHPPALREDVDDRLLDLHDLARQSQQLLSGDATDVLPQLLRAGGSPGGARPKVLVGVDPNTGALVSGADELSEGFEHWLVKFAARQDARDAGPLEQAYALMATAAGIEIPPTRLFETAQGDRFFGVKRFDRDGRRRVHVHTFGNLIHANFRIPSSDYGDLLKVTSILTRNQADVVAVYRRMVFNVATHNRDDHVKNFAFLLDEAAGEWSLTPAYDLTFATGPGGEHSMTLAGEGRDPGREHFLRLAKQCSISTKAALNVINEVRAAVAGWAGFAELAKVHPAAAEQVASSLPPLD